MASRVISLAVGSLSLLVALLGILKFAVPGIDAWSEGKELLFGATVVGIIIASYLLAVWLTRPRLLPATDPR